MIAREGARGLEAASDGCAAKPRSRVSPPQGHARPTARQSAQRQTRPCAADDAKRAGATIVAPALLFLDTRLVERRRDGGLVPLLRADAVDALHRQDEDLAVAHLARAAALENGVDRRLDERVGHAD